MPESRETQPGRSHNRTSVFGWLFKERVWAMVKPRIALKGAAMGRI